MCGCRQVVVWDLSRLALRCAWRQGNILPLIKAPRRTVSGCSSRQTLPALQTPTYSAPCNFLASASQWLHRDQIARSMHQKRYAPTHALTCSGKPWSHSGIRSWRQLRGYNRKPAILVVGGGPAARTLSATHVYHPAPCPSTGLFFSCLLHSGTCCLQAVYRRS